MLVVDSTMMTSLNNLPAAGGWPCWLHSDGTASSGHSGTAESCMLSYHKKSEVLPLSLSFLQLLLSQGSMGPVDWPQYSSGETHLVFLPVLL